MTTLFTATQRAERPLNVLLDRWSSTARQNAEGVHVVTFEAKSDPEIVESLLTEWRRAVEPPLTRVGVPGLIQEPLPGGQDEAEVFWWWVAQFRFEGNTELLKSWPRAFETTCADETGANKEGELYWSETSDGCMATLATSRADDPDGTNVPRAAFLEAAEYLDQFVTAICSEVSAYDEQLRRDMAVIVGRRRARLATIAAQNVEVVELLRRPLKPLEVTFPEPRPSTEPPMEVHLNPVLKRATFSGLVDVTCRWRNGVEKYPLAFGQLDEDSLSSLLVTTLNVAFDTAQREVFSLGGKTDIYVEAVRGNRENAAFFGEAVYLRPTTTETML
jgi:hypothetical protein